MTWKGFFGSLAIGVISGVVAIYVAAAGIWWFLGISAIIPVLYLAISAIAAIWRMGIVWLFPSWGNKRTNVESRLIAQSKSVFRFWTITGRTSLNRADVERAILAQGAASGCEFRFLLMHPESLYLVRFCAAEGSDPVRTSEKIRETTRVLLELRDKGRLKLDVRWDRRYPTWRIAAIDTSQMHLGFYAEGRKGYEGYRVVLTERGKESLIRQFLQSFDEAWESAARACDEAGCQDGTDDAGKVHLESASAIGAAQQAERHDKAEDQRTAPSHAHPHTKAPTSKHGTRTSR